jgi:hypothetical protein
MGMTVVAIPILRNLHFFTTIDCSKVGNRAAAIFCCPMAFCSWFIIPINKKYYLISIHPAYCVNNVYTYVATLHVANGITIYHWAVVAVDGCLVTVQSFFTVNIHMCLL